MSLPVLLSSDALSFWNSPRAEEREPFRASVMADVLHRATMEGQPVEIYADPESPPIEVVHPCLELEPCPGCSVAPCQCP